MRLLHRARTTLMGLMLLASPPLAAGPAMAEAPWPALAQMGVAGTWAARCDSRPSAKNWFHTYDHDSDGRTRRKIERGWAGSDLYSIVESARRLTPRTFQLRLRNDGPNWGEADGDAFDLVVEITGGVFRALTSTRIRDGMQFIRDGKATSTNQPIPLLRRCR